MLLPRASWLLFPGKRCPPWCPPLRLRLPDIVCIFQQNHQACAEHLHGILCHSQHLINGVFISLHLRSLVDAGELTLCSTFISTRVLPQISSAVSERRPSPTTPRTSEECARKMSSSCQAARATDVLVARESDAVDEDDSEHESAVEADGDDVPDELASLRELISTQRDDLRTAALIGQRLVDANDELSAQLEVGTNVADRV